MKYFRLVSITLLALCAACAQSAKDPFIGTWKLNAAKSKFNPGPGPKSQTVTIGADGKVTVESVQTGGTETWSYTYVDGQEAPITG